MAFAVVDIAGTQEKVASGMKLRIPFLSEKKEGEKIVFPNVLLISKSAGDAEIGTPYVSGASVEATVLRHGKGEKILVYKMKHRKRYRRSQGHRQQFTEIEVTEVRG